MSVPKSMFYGNKAMIDKKEQFDLLPDYGSNNDLTYYWKWNYWKWNYWKINKLHKW